MDRAWARMRQLAPLIGAAIALVAALQVPALSLTAPALEVALQPAPALVEPMLVTDGVTVWRDWAPLQVWLATADLATSRWLQVGLWVALALAVYALARGLGATASGAAAAASLAAAHPVAAAAYADAAGRGALLAALGMTSSVALALYSTGAAPSRRMLLALGAGIAGLLGALGEPLALVLPVITTLCLWSHWRGQERPRPAWWRSLAWEALVAQLLALGLVMLMRALVVPELPVSAEANPAAVGGEEVGILEAGALAARALRIAALGAPLTRQPWEIDWSRLGVADLGVWLGWAALLLLPILARLARARPVASSGLHWLWAVVVALCQLAEPLPSAQAPALCVLALVGATLVLGGMVRHAWGLLPVLLGCGVLLAFPARQAAAWFESEEAVLRHELSVAPEATAPRVALARRHLEAGRPEKALELTERSNAPEAVEVRIRALLGLGRWGTARGDMGELPEARRAVLGCLVASAARDVGAVRLCEAARARDSRDLSVLAAYAQALESDRRLGDAERVLRAELAGRPGDPVVLLALATFLERQGWLREAVEVREAWLAAHPDDGRALAGLRVSLIRKGRGDLLERRHEEAVRTFVRLLEIAPEEHAMRFYLADAYRATGQARAADHELETARAHGAAPPPAPDAVPGPERAPPGGGAGAMLRPDASAPR